VWWWCLYVCVWWRLRVRVWWCVCVCVCSHPKQCLRRMTKLNSKRVLNPGS
jgi:hypothetical protein